MSQFGPETDEKLNQASRTIGKSLKIIEEEQARFDKTWSDVYEIFDEFGKERFLADDGNYLNRQHREGTPQLRQDALREKLTPEQLAEVEEVTVVRTINTAKLEVAVQKGIIPASIVESCITPGTPSYPRMRKPWTAADKKLASELGIKVSEEETE